ARLLRLQPGQACRGGSSHPRHTDGLSAVDRDRSGVPAARGPGGEDRGRTRAASVRIPERARRAGGAEQTGGPEMIRVRAPSRLHFGLLNCGIADERLGRLFGGAGLMVGQPGLSLAVRPALAWSAEGPLADRALAVARRFAETLPSGAL